MIIIHVTSEELRKTAKQVMQHELKFNPNLNGADFLVKMDFYDYIEGAGAITGAQLFYRIFHRH